MQRPTDDQLISDLGSDKRTARRRAARLLGKRRVKAAVPALVEHLRDGSSYVQAASAVALGKIHDPATIPALLEMFEGKTYSFMTEDGAPHRFNRILGTAGMVLARFHLPETTEPLYAALADAGANFKGDETTLYTRAESVSYIGGERAYNMLREIWISSTTSPVMRVFLAKGLGRCGVKAALLDLLDAMGDPYATVRAAAAEGLGLLGNTSAVAPLIFRFLNAETGLNSNTIPYHVEEFRVSIARSLGQINNFIGTNALRLALTQPQYRFAAAVGLASARDRAMCQILIPFAASKDHLQWGKKLTALDALAVLDDPAALPVFQTFARENEYSGLANHPDVEDALDRWQGLV